MLQAIQSSIESRSGKAEEINNEYFWLSYVREEHMHKIAILHTTKKNQQITYHRKHACAKDRVGQIDGLNMASIHDQEKQTQLERGKGKKGHSCLTDRMTDNELCFQPPSYYFVTVCVGPRLTPWE